MQSSSVSKLATYKSYMVCLCLTILNDRNINEAAYEKSMHHRNTTKLFIKKIICIDFPRAPSRIFLAEIPGISH